MLLTSTLFTEKKALAYSQRVEKVFLANGPC
jgi:hypothetical protein